MKNICWSTLLLMLMGSAFIRKIGPMNEIYCEGAETNIFPNKGAAYFSVVRFDNKIHIYFRRRRDYSNTMHMVSDDGLNFSLCEPVLAKSYACHNFSAYIGANGTIEAIGGQIGSLEMPYNKGLYHFISEDGSQFQETGLIVGEGHPNYVNGMSWGLEAELDGHQCCVFDQSRQRYILFLRANPVKGDRTIQMSEKKLGGKFGPFSLIQIGITSQNNYYSSNFFRIGLFKFGLVPFVVDEFCSIRLIASLNYSTWWICSDFFKSKPWYSDENKPKNRDHPVQGIINRGQFVEFYVHHNYLGSDAAVPVSIKRYRIRKRSLYRVAVVSFGGFVRAKVMGSSASE